MGGKDLILMATGLDRPRDVLEPFERDLRALHLSHERRVGQRVEKRERFQVSPIRVPREEQRIGLDRVEHRGRDALGDVDVDRSQVLGEDGRSRAVVRADVLERGGVAAAFGVMVDHQVDSVQ